MWTGCCVRAQCVLQWLGAILESLGAESTVSSSVDAGCRVYSSVIGCYAGCALCSRTVARRGTSDCFPDENAEAQRSRPGQ